MSTDVQTGGEPGVNQPVDEIREEVQAAPGELDDHELEKLKAKALKLIKQRPEVASASATLLTAHRLHSVAMVALQRMTLEETGGFDAKLVQFFIHAAKNQARVPFKRQELFDNLVQGLLPWLQTELRAENDREASAEAQEAEQREAERRSQPVATHWGALVNRDRTWSLVGSAEVRKQAFDALAAGFAQQDVRVLRLSETLGMREAGEKQWTLPLNNWLGCVQSERKLVETLQPALTKLGEVDVLLVDNAALGEGDVKFAVVAKAAACHRKFRKLADTLGCALIIGVPELAEEPFDRSKTGWSQLETYTTLSGLKLDQEAGPLPTEFTY